MISDLCQVPKLSGGTVLNYGLGRICAMYHPLTFRLFSYSKSHTDSS